MPIAPPPTPPPTSRRHAPLRRLAGLTALVLGAHWLLLQGVPKALMAFQLRPQDEPLAFTTRTIEAPTLPARPISTVKPAQPKPRAPKPLPQVPAPPPEPTPEPAPPAPLDTASQVAAAGATDSGNGAATSEDDAAASAGATPGEGTAAAPAPATSEPAQDALTQDGTTPAVEPVVAPAVEAQPVYRFAFPEPVRLLYDVKGVVTFAYTGGAEMVWKHDGANYTASLQITKFGFNLRNWTSKGTLGPQGIAPTRFGDKGRSSEIAAHFQRDKGVVSFSKNAPEVPLQSGAQDHLSAFFQLSGMLAADPARFAPDTLVPFQAVNAHGSEAWVFKVGALETLDLPGGPREGILLTREHSAQYDTKVEVWLAPEVSYLPVRIRLSQTNGDFAELLWSSTQKAP